jgi:NAD(P)-dependent dehydrogenase (short-subunit alcohol dehydrogenase family)
MAQLTDSVALVTGGSRGAGRGIALELGAAGATVYVTGRSFRGGGGAGTARARHRGGCGCAWLMRTERVVEAFRRAGAEAALDGPGGPQERPRTWDARSWRWHRTGG